ncbi:MAG: glycosyl transferase, partial [Alphaproteobacteria bacterium]|nr:glycosyl transferase [Alphaproteobacteria bacterium]
KRFAGFKARALVALLIYLGPLLRGRERLKWRLKEMRTQDHIRLVETEQRAAVHWRARAFQLAYWSDAGVEKEVLIGGLMDFLLPQKYFVVPDTGWSNWDLKIARGLWSRALLLVCTENHGGTKRLLRVRCAMRFSRFAMFVLRSCAALTAVALILGWPLAAAAIGAVGLINSGVMGCQLIGFARLMHRIIEAVAKQARLLPLDPVRRSPLPIRAPKPV